MCGFAGILECSRRSDNDALRATVVAMAQVLEHRGPDDAGAWVDQQAGVALGFRRLSILDLSPRGYQPMESAGGRYVITFNGEIYNFRELRAELERQWGDGPAAFRGHSDTEVLLAAIEAWGLPRALDRSTGMFAFALWDRLTQTLSLARDRLGEKPLYYGWAGDCFVFGSELKALVRHPQFTREVDRDALVPYVRHGYIPAPWSAYQDARKLRPGTVLTVRVPQPGDWPEPVPYWSARAAAEAGALCPIGGDEAEVAGQLDALLRRTVSRQMIADVPLGAFLSGGVDSSTIVALMQAQSTRPVKTFTIGFDEPGYDEAAYARAMARHLGTEHAELYVSPREAMEIVPRLPELYDEPFADASQLPTYLVSRLASQQVTVCLSGDGGDEVFGGYDWYRRTLDAWGAARRVPGRCAAGMALRRTLPAGRARRIGELLESSARPESLHQSLLSKWGGAGAVVLDGREPDTSLVCAEHWPASDADPLTSIQCFDMLTYLPDAILTKVDRASMAASLECRAPFLDHAVVEFAFRLPPALRLRGRTGKWLLRQVARRYVPGELLDRPKGGFNVPLDRWLRGPLLDWAESMLDARALREAGYFHPGRVRRRWREHLSGRRDRQEDLWHVLMFQSWLQHGAGR